MTAIAHDWRPAFLAAFETSTTVAEAAQAAGVGVVLPFVERKRNPGFAQAWAAVREEKFYERKRCEQCGADFSHPRRSGKPGRFCTEACKVAHQREAGEANAVPLFWEKVDRNGPVPAHRPELGACWVWTASADGMGYGMYRHTRAHRYSWELAHGPIENELCVLHHCDNPPCVRPEHLFLDTRDANMADRQAKERQARGERQGRARLTAEQVLEARALRAQGVQVKDLAARYGVAAVTMSHACNGLSWRHLS